MITGLEDRVRAVRAVIQATVPPGALVVCVGEVRLFQVLGEEVCDLLSIGIGKFLGKRSLPQTIAPRRENCANLIAGRSVQPDESAGLSFEDAMDFKVIELGCEVP
jgi:hypothetical protein